MKTNIFRYGTYGPWRQFLLLGTIYIEGSLIFIEQFRARLPWSIGVLESWLSMSSSSSEVPASSILRIPSPRRFVPGSSLRASAANTPTVTTTENVRHRNFGRRRRHRQSGFQHTDRSRPSSPELFNKDHFWSDWTSWKCWLMSRPTLF